MTSPTFASPACNNGRQIDLRAPFVGNRVSPSAFSPAAMKFLDFVPVSDDPCGLYQFGIPNDNDENQILTKVDLPGQRQPIGLRPVPLCRSTTTRPSTTARTC